MLEIHRSIAYRKAFRKLSKSETFGSSEREKLENVIWQIQHRERLDQKYRDHELSGGMAGIRECHIKPDLLLIYKVEADVLTLILLNLGSHSELFD